MEKLGRFRLREQIGTGPYAIAYEGVDGATRCVVKIFKDEAVPQEAGRRAGLVRALEGLKGIEHPSAVRVLESGEADGKLFVATEFMDCPTLAAKLHEAKRLAEQQVVLYIRQSAQALDKARDVGYCHGDLTSKNVFVVSQEKVKLSDFAVKYLVENPPELGDLSEQGGAAEGGGKDEWVTAEDLLRSKGKKTTKVRLDDDFVGLAVLMMQMLGVALPERAQGASLENYREDLVHKAYPQVSDRGSGVGVHVSEVVRRLLTPGEFDSPGEVVVELASAMLLGRTFGRPRPAAPAKPAAAAAETAQVRVQQATEQELELGLEAEEPAKPAEEAPTVEVAAGAGGDMTFFIWTDRRSGRFFVVHEGEEIALGRDPDVCDVVVMDPTVSRKHCLLSKEGSVVRVSDAGSSNGTYVNEERVQKAEVRASDRLRIGTTRLYMSMPGER